MAVEIFLNNYGSVKSIKKSAVIDCLLNSIINFESFDFLKVKATK